MDRRSMGILRFRHYDSKRYSWATSEHASGTADFGETNRFAAGCAYEDVSAPADVGVKVTGIDFTECTPCIARYCTRSS
jgi:hypothetical protein